MVWIICCGAPKEPLPERCGAAAFEAAMAALPEAEILPYAGKPLEPAGRKVYCAPGRRARRTAEQMLPGAEILTEPLLAAIPCRAFRETERPLPLPLWRWLARRQAASGDPRQPESREESVRRAETLIARIEKEGKDCVLLPDESFLPLLLERFRLHSCAQRRSGLGRFQPFERILITPRVLHCGGCAHNCLLSNPGCGVGRDKAVRQAQAQSRKKA